jgi:hypothetical protein
MDPANSMQAQNTAIALAQSSHAMRLGHTIYTSRLMNGPHPLPIANNTATDTGTATTVAVGATAPVSATTLATAVPTSSDVAKPAPQSNPLPQNLIDDMVMMKALSQYRGVANGTSTPGSSVDITN